MQTMVIILIGLAAAGYIGRIVWKELHGQSQCHCAGGCGGCSRQQTK